MNSKINDGELCTGWGYSGVTVLTSTIEGAQVTLFSL